MTKYDLIHITKEFTASYSHTPLTAEMQALLGTEDMCFFDEPLVGFGSADDRLFEQLKAPEAVGPQFIPPKEWLENAKSVISIFIPYSEAVKKANNTYPKAEIAPHYVHAKNYTVPFINKLVEKLCLEINKKGYNTVVPSSETARLKSAMAVFEGRKSYTSPWSERHIAYICGLGSFGIHKGIITEKGALGRFISIVTDMPLEADERQYSELYEYCTLCGACGRKCPADAITTAEGKDKVKCSVFVDSTKAKYAPLYGCAKCMCGVPCANGRPKKR